MTVLQIEILNLFFLPMAFNTTRNYKNIRDWRYAVDIGGIFLPKEIARLIAPPPPPQKKLLCHKICYPVRTIAKENSHSSVCCLPCKCGNRWWHDEYVGDIRPLCTYFEACYGLPRPLCELLLVKIVVFDLTDEVRTHLNYTMPGGEIGRGAQLPCLLGHKT
jgi:hypothetical protein